MIRQNKVVILIRNFFQSSTPVPLGRWKVSNSIPNPQTNLKIDYSNEDHCGSCSQYVNLKRKEFDKNKYN